MDEALIKNAKNDVNGSESRNDEHKLIGKRILKGLRGSLKRSVNRVGHFKFTPRSFDVLDCGTKRSAGRKIERERDRWKNSLVVHGKRGIGWLVMSKSAERNKFP